MKHFFVSYTISHKANVLSFSSGRMSLEKLTSQEIDNFRIREIDFMATTFNINPNDMACLINSVVEVESHD